jgi:hypothetical protein
MVQIDVGFGDVVEPAPAQITFPILLPLDPPIVRGYPPETVIAEKFQAMVMLGIGNSRMKDFFDIWTLARTHNFRLQSLGRSVRQTAQLIACRAVGSSVLRNVHKPILSPDCRHSV